MRHRLLMNSEKVLVLLGLSFWLALHTVEEDQAVALAQAADHATDELLPQTIQMRSSSLAAQFQHLTLMAPLTTSFVAASGLDPRAQVIQAQIVVPVDAPSDLGVGAFIKDDDGTWFQLAHKVPLKPGHHHVHFPLNAETQWVSEPGTIRWSNYHILKGQHYGLYFWSEQKSKSIIEIQSIRSSSEYVIAAQKPYLCTDIEIDGYDAISQIARAQTGQRWDLRFRPDPFPQNPYDSTLLSMDLVISQADGNELHFPCFYQQHMNLRDGGNREIAEADMQSFYAGRFRPMRAGTYQVRIEATWQAEALIEEQAATAESISRTFPICTLEVQGPDYDPYLRVDESDYRFFSYGAGEKQFHFPVGLNIQCISDKRAVTNVGSAVTPVRGLLSYEAYLDRLARGGGNSAEIWLSSWNLALEWNDAWPDQHGVGMYSEANAERLERLLDYAWERGIRVILVINNHGQASAKSDPEWKESPYNKENGGWLTHAGEMFTDERARIAQQKVRRYLVGRYADHPAIMCWKMWSEMNLTGANKEQLVDWHAWAFDDWRTMDHYYRHPVTSHWCGDYRNPDPKLVSLPQMDFIAIDAYHKQGFLPGLLDRSTLDPQRGLGQFNKPTVVTEFGGNWNACPKPQLLAEHQIGAWCALVTGHGSAPHLWWFEWVDQNDLWQPYGAITTFLAGEDLRDAQARSLELALIKDDIQQTDMRIWNRAWLHKQDTTAYFVDYLWALNGLTTPLIEAYACKIPATPGNYRIEWWDASVGTCLQAESIEHSNTDDLVLNIPAFRRHLALKVRAIADSALPLKISAGTVETEEKPAQ